MSRLEVITGPMFSGKTEELVRRLHRAEIAGKKISAFKPAIDNRYESKDIVTHNGMYWKSYVVAFSDDILVLSNGSQVVGIDEGQFFGDDLIYVVDELLNNKIKVIICGLDKDFATQNFGAIPRLMVLADRVDKLTAVCNKCGGDDASFTQRLVDGKPAAFDGPTILVGGTESYQARCRDCFEIG